MFSSPRLRYVATIIEKRTRKKSAIDRRADSPDLALVSSPPGRFEASVKGGLINARLLQNTANSKAAYKKTVPLHQRTRYFDMPPHDDKK